MGVSLPAWASALARNVLRVFRIRSRVCLLPYAYAAGQAISHFTMVGRRSQVRASADRATGRATLSEGQDARTTPSYRRSDP